jgi:subtilisin family serine protease
VRVLNLSLGCYADQAPAREVMREIIDSVREVNPDMVIVAAAGNREQTKSGRFTELGDYWPAALENVVAVCAVERPGETTWAEWSNRRPWIDFAASRSDLLSTYIEGYLPPRAEGKLPKKEVKHYEGWATWSGTSFAAALVSGALALLVRWPDRPTAAAEALARLRVGDDELTGGRTKAKDEVPSVPVVKLQTCEAQAQAKENCAFGEQAAG